MDDSNLLSGHNCRNLFSEITDLDAPVSSSTGRLQWGSVLPCAPNCHQGFYGVLLCVPFTHSSYGLSSRRHVPTAAGLGDVTLLPAVVARHLLETTVVRPVSCPVASVTGFGRGCLAFSTRIPLLRSGAACR